MLDLSVQGDAQCPLTDLTRAIFFHSCIIIFIIIILPVDFVHSPFSERLVLSAINSIVRVFAWPDHS